MKISKSFYLLIYVVIINFVLSFHEDHIRRNMKYEWAVHCYIASDGSFGLNPALSQISTTAYAILAYIWHEPWLYSIFTLDPMIFFLHIYQIHHWCKSNEDLMETYPISILENSIVIGTENCMTISAHISQHHMNSLLLSCGTMPGRPIIR